MVSCKHCHTPNSLDSTFCKRCGTAITEAELQEAQAKLDKLIEEGNSLFNQGRTDEALAVAEAAANSNPSSTSALSLKILCHERRGEIAEALECADRLVELNPDSEFDRIRRATLRQKLQTDLAIPAGPDRRLATVGAAAAIVLVLCLGAIAARLSSNAPANGRTAMNDVSPQTTLNPQTAFANPGPGSSTELPKNAAVPQPNAGAKNPSPTEGLVTQPQADSVPPLRANAPARETGFSEAPEVHLPVSQDTSLPDVGGGGLTVEPVHPNVPSNLTNPPITPKPSAQPKSGGTDDEPRFADAGNGPKDITSERNKPAQDNGIMEIRVRQSGSSRGNGGSEPIGGTGLEALLRVGSQQYQMGNFAGAAKSYEQAVRAGGDAIILNRRLAQAYERLGRSSDAADAYHKCISAIDSAIASGRGNKDSLSNTRDVCEQALKVLQGG